MANPETTWVSPKFFTDGDPAAGETALPDGNQW